MAEAERVVQCDQWPRKTEIQRARTPRFCLEKRTARRESLIVCSPQGSAKRLLTTRIRRRNALFGWRQRHEIGAWGWVAWWRWIHKERMCDGCMCMAEMHRQHLHLRCHETILP